MEMIASISDLEERFYLFYMVPINVRLMQCKCFKSLLISACSLLACFQLIQIPSTNAQITLILVHAGSEVKYLIATNFRCFVRIGAVRARFGIGSGIGLSFNRSGRSTTKEASDSMSNRRTDGNTAI
jgi:hypothetical protein